MTDNFPLELNVVFNENCLETMKRIPDNSIDAIVTDPPYEGGFPDVIAKNHHPTVKPTSLLKYLCRLVTPSNGIIYDPFSGYGSTGKAAILEGFNFIGSELDAEYTIIANARIQYAIANKDELDEKYVLEHIEKVMPKSVPTVKDNEYF